MSQFKSFSRKKFEYELLQLKNKDLISRYEDITEKWSRMSGVSIYEIVYELTVPYNRFFKIIIYSSVKRFGEQSREKGKDAIRVNLLWYMKGQLFIQPIRTLYRVEGLFNNIETTVKNIENYIQNENPELRDFYLLQNPQEQQ